VPDALDEIRATLEPTSARVGVHLIVAPSVEALPRIRADRTRFLQILMNFTTNAIKYNQPGGKVTVNVRRAGDKALRVSVIDTGVGIPVDKQDKLFQPFQRAGQETGPIEGTGIGLVITKRLAELMGGSVGFQSAPGHGSQFWVELPIESARTDAIGVLRTGAEPAPRFGSSSRRLVLYVEDNPANVSFMRDVLGDFEELDLATAPTAEMGIELALGRRPDAIIMDINLPGMSGVEALARIREEPSIAHVPVIALTAAASERDRQRGTQAGFYRYLTKPIQIEELLGALEAVFSTRSS
jgi:CheY-like chemotaxis protein